MGEKSLEQSWTRSAREPDEDVINQSTPRSTSATRRHGQPPPDHQAGQLPAAQRPSTTAQRHHIEPFPTFIRIRYALDGVLREIPSPPRNQLVAIVSRIKVMATMTSPKPACPDGRLKLAVEGRRSTCAVSSCPTVHGEAIVMRVLDKNMMMIGIKPGWPDGRSAGKNSRNSSKRPNGIVLVTGPTAAQDHHPYAALARSRTPAKN